MNLGAIRLELLNRRLSMGRWAGWALLALAGLATAWHADRHARLAESLEQLARQRDVLALRLNGPRGAAHGRVDPSVQSRVARASPVLAHLALPWDALFGAVEAADSRRLALLTLEPNARDASLRLSGEAASMAELMAYIDRLGRQPLLAQVHLANFETVQRDGAQVVVFGVQARWIRE
jgi:hypothetical protein